LIAITVHNKTATMMHILYTHTESTTKYYSVIKL